MGARPVRSSEAAGGARVTSICAVGASPVRPSDPTEMAVTKANARALPVTSSDPTPGVSVTGVEKLADVITVPVGVAADPVRSRMFVLVIPPAPVRFHAHWMKMY